MKIIKRVCYYTYSMIELLVNVKNWPLLIPIFLKNSMSGERTIKLRQPPVQFKTRGVMDIWSVKETFLDAFYTRYGVPLQDGWIVMDIGAGIGDFSICAAYGRPNTLVYAYEPFPESHQLLLENLEENNIENVLPFQAAMWCDSGLLDLDLTGGEPLQIASKSADGISHRANRITVKAITLQEALDGQGIENVDLIKLDCEGAEYEIIMNAPSEVLDRIHRIVMEYHDVDESHDHNRLVEFLRDAGYQVTHQVNIVHKHIGYLFAERHTLHA